VGAILVINDKEDPVGIFTERDLVRIVADKHDELKGITIEDMMTKDPVIGFPDDNADKLKSVMTCHSVALICHRAGREYTFCSFKLQSLRIPHLAYH